MLVKDLYYKKYLKYKNKYLNLQSQIGGDDKPVFMIIIDGVGQHLVVPAFKYEAYAYNKYFAIKQQSNPIDKPLVVTAEGMTITYTIRSDKVEFEIIVENGDNYKFEIKDFKDGDKSFCILVEADARYQVRLLSNNEELLEAYATEEESQRLWRIQHTQMQIDARKQKDREYIEKLRQEQQEAPQSGERAGQLIQERTWFSDIFGFSERPKWEENVKMFKMVGDNLICNTASPQFKSQYVGRFECLSVAELRKKELELPGDVERLSFMHFASGTSGIGPMHSEESNNGAVFQAASQFNCLEMIGTDKSPTDGITIYINDKTQGPVCALVCPAALVYRNYLVEHVVNGKKYTGQHPVQIDNLKDVGTVVDNNTNKYWNMQNGYAMPVDSNSISNLARRLLDEPTLVKKAEDALRVGVHWNTSVKPPSTNRVCQVYASALPCAYAPDTPLDDWEPFARLVLRASYKATLSVAASLTIGGAKRIKCYLTALGGGVFENKHIWISEAITEALNMYRYYPIDVVLVHYGSKVHKDWITLPKRETMEERLEREQAENALREKKVFIAYPTEAGSFERPIYQVAEAKPHQKEAYKIFMRFVKGEITKSVTETVDDMKIVAISTETERGKIVNFNIKKTYEQEPYIFRIEEFSDRFRDEVKYSLFCNLIDKYERVSYLSNNEPLLKKWVRNKTISESY